VAASKQIAGSAFFYNNFHSFRYKIPAEDALAAIKNVAPAA
jgi:hypothetical protein